jgi:hypothetical protein
MKCITLGLQNLLQSIVPQVDLSPLPGKKKGKLRLSPEQLLVAIQAETLAEWALFMTHRLHPPALPRGSAGRPQQYSDRSILLMALVQIVWRKSYEQIVDYVATHPALAQALGFTQGTICKGRFWERRAALGLLPFLFFFLGLVGQLIRLGVISGQALIVDSSLLAAWYHADPGATWQRYARKLVGWFIVLVAAVLYAFRVLVVYADAGYFDWRFLRVVGEILGAHAAVDYNPRRSGKRKLATLFFLGQWRRLVITPRSDIERHFAWMKRYFGLKYFQCFSWMRVTQFVLLTYCAALAVALAAQRYERPELIRRRAMVLAQL